MNRARMLELADIIEGGTLRDTTFNMADCIFRTPCGTQADIAGYAILVYWPAAHPRRYLADYIHHTAFLLELKNMQAFRLVLGRWPSLEKLEPEDRPYSLEEYTPAMAAVELRRIVAEDVAREQVKEEVSHA